MPDSVRERLVDAAFALFGERGFERTTVDDIAERAGVGRTTFFRHFGSKEQVIFPDHDGLLEAIRTRLSTSRPATATVAVSEAARGVLEHYVAEGDRARERYAPDPDRRRPCATANAPASGQYVRLFTGFIHDWLGGGPETALRAELLANAVVTAHNHVLRGWLRGEVADPEAAFDTAMAEVASLFEVAGRRPQGAAGTTVVLLRTDKDPETLRSQIERLL